MGVNELETMSGTIIDDVTPAQRQIYPRVKEFFAGKVVAITGGTGFLGQGIVEKLLRTCPEIKQIILLIRTKKDVEPKDRLEQLMQLPAFEVLRNSRPDFAEKLAFMSCDLEQLDLGLDDKSTKVFQNDVNIFFNCAATMRFNEHLRASFDMNVQSVRRLIRLFGGMKSLQSFVHVSSAYAHCDHSKIDEKIYNCEIDYLDLESSLRWMSDDLITRITPDILGKRPNTYTFTKALGEEVLTREGRHLPICIVRPSMIVPALNEPLPGWCTNVYGPTAFFVAYGKGLLRSVIADEGIVADLIPVDLVVNGAIAAAVKTACDYRAESTLPPERLISSGVAATHKEGTDQMMTSRTRWRSPPSSNDDESKIPIYNFTTGAQNPLYISDLVKLGTLWYGHYPLDPVRLPTVSLTLNRFFHNISLLLRQTLPAFAYDVFLSLTNQKRKMVRLNNRLMSGMNVMEFFFTNEWRWGVENAIELQKSMADEDQKTFSFDPSSFSWKDQIKHYVMGTRRFLVKEDMNNYQSAREAVKRLQRIHRFIDWIAVLGVISYTGLSSLIWKSIVFLWTFLGLV